MNLHLLQYHGHCIAFCHAQVFPICQQGLHIRPCQLILLNVKDRGYCSVGVCLIYLQFHILNIIAEVKYFLVNMTYLIIDLSTEHCQLLACIVNLEKGVIWYQSISPLVPFGDSVLNSAIRLVDVADDRIIKYGKAFFIDNHTNIVLLLLQRYDR